MWFSELQTFCQLAPTIKLITKLTFADFVGKHNSFLPGLFFKKIRRKKERKKERERRREGGSEEGRRKEGGRKQGREEALWTVFDVISHCVFKCPKLAKVPFVSPL